MTNVYIYCGNQKIAIVTPFSRYFGNFIGADVSTLDTRLDTAEKMILDWKEKGPWSNEYCIKIEEEN